MKKRMASGMLKMVTFLLIALHVFAIKVSANDNVLSIYRKNPEDSIPFKVYNMFPGDCETNFYNIRVSYNGSIKVYFHADVRSGSEKLAEKLKCKVVLDDKDTLLYDGLMKDMPDLEHSLSAVHTTEDLKYKISVYLDTSVGNDYQNTQLIADFRWWAYTSDEGYPGGGGSGGGTIHPVIPPGDSDEPIVTPPNDENDTPGSSPDDSQSPGTEPSSPQPPKGENEQPSSSGAQRPTGELISPPNTGDIANPILWIILICISLFIILVFILFNKKKDKSKEKNPLIKKLTVCIVIIVILAICLCITTFALVYSITVDENIFKTGTVEINLNDGNPVISEDEFLFEPGMTVRKDFFIENQSSDAVYYKIYFDKVFGSLAKVLDVKIFDKETGAKLYSGKAEDLKRENCTSAELSLNETRMLTVEFRYPEESGNNTQNMNMSFDMCAVATQKRNNPYGKFD